VLASSPCTTDGRRQRTVIIFDLYTPPILEQKSYNNCFTGGIQRKGKYKTHYRISALDDAHARIAPYAHQLRVILDEPCRLDNKRGPLLEFEAICKDVKCQPVPTRVYRVEAYAMRFFKEDFINQVSYWIETLDWKNAFQIEGYIRCGLLNTYDLLFTLQKPIEDVIRDYGPQASQFLGLFSAALRTRSPSETPDACLARFRVENPTIKPLKLAQDHILCHHVVITPSRILLEGPFPTQSNRVIRQYRKRDPTLVDRFVRVEFRDEDHLAYRWDGNVDGALFVQQRVGVILHKGFKLGGRLFEFLAYSNSSLREHSAWFFAPFHDPVEGFVNAKSIRDSLGDFSKLRRMPSKLAARIGQAFTATEPSVMIQCDQLEEQDDLGPHTDGVGTISPDLAGMIWEDKCRATGSPMEDRVKPSAYQFRFLGYKGVVVVDSRLKGIKMRLRKSQDKFSVHGVTEAEFEIARSFGYPNPAHLNRSVVLSHLWAGSFISRFSRPAVMALEDLGVNKKAFMDLQNAAKEKIYLSSNSLKTFAETLGSHGLGDKFRLAFILKQLFKLGLDFKDYLNKEAIRSAFLGRLVRDSMNHALREMKFKARIPVPHSFQLVGVADEGQAYIKEGEDPDKVFTLKEGFIYGMFPRG
jgi:RNA-dependent RNA polymerase